MLFEAEIIDSYSMYPILIIYDYMYIYIYMYDYIYIIICISSIQTILNRNCHACCVCTH